MNEITVLEKKSVDVVAKAQSIAITNNEQYTGAAEFTKGIKALQKEVKDAFDPIIQKAYSAHKEAVAQKDKYLKPLLTAEANLKSKMIAFVNEQERLRREEEARLAEIQRKEAEKLAKRAEKAEAKGQTEKAEELFQQAQETAAIAPTVERKVKDVAGIKYRENWKAEVFDIMALCKAVASGTVSINTIEANMSALNQMARAMKNTISIPGVKFICEKILSAGV